MSKCILCEKLKDDGMMRNGNFYCVLCLTNSDEKLIVQTNGVQISINYDMICKSFKNVCGYCLTPNNVNEDSKKYGCVCYGCKNYGNKNYLE
jgi:hypothetical protein